MKFRDWMLAVDQEFNARLGLTSRDLADRPYWDRWKDGYSSTEMVDEILDEEGIEA